MGIIFGVVMETNGSYKTPVATGRVYFFVRWRKYATLAASVPGPPLRGGLRQAHWRRAELEAAPCLMTTVGNNSVSALKTITNQHG